LLLHSKMKAEGKVRVVLTNVETGEVDQDEEFNTLLTPITGWVANCMAAVEFADEAGIALGTGSDQSYNKTNRDAHESLGGTWVDMAQGIPGTFQPIREVLLALRRVGDVGAATMWLTIEGTTGTQPDGTPITNGTSQIIQCAAIPTASFEWMSFVFSPAFDLGTAGFIRTHIINHSHSAGVAEVQVGYDATSSTYGGGSLVVDDVGGGASWGPHPVATSDMVFRCVREIDPVLNALPSDILDFNGMVSVGATGDEIRLLSLFGTTEAVERIREMYLMRTSVELSEGALAVAMVNVNKTDQHVLQAYWLIQFSIDPDNP
jgi:hypothetical protein